MCFIRLLEVRFFVLNKVIWWVYGYVMVGSLDLIDVVNLMEIERI